MGQYYFPVLRDHGKQNFKSYRAGYAGGAKLTEHSWWKNPLCNGIAEKLYHNPMHLYWVGDYSMDCPTHPPTKAYRAAWGARNRPERIGAEDFTLDGKVLVNHTKKQILSCDFYYTKLSGKNKWGPEWVMHPLSLLTAYGNGLGGGDYRGENENDIGAWGGDLISVEDSPYYKPDYTEVFYRFWED